GLDAAPPPPAPEPESEAASSRAIVQPNFEVVLLDARPHVVADLQAFSENAGIGAAGDRARVFKLTKASVHGAARAGLDAKAILGTLERLSSTGVPDNVARAIRDWAGAIRRVSIGTSRFIRCPDADTLARVQAVLGPLTEP